MKKRATTARGTTEPMQVSANRTRDKGSVVIGSFSRASGRLQAVLPRGRLHRSVAAGRDCFLHPRAGRIRGGLARLGALLRAALPRGARGPARLRPLDAD